MAHESHAEDTLFVIAEPDFRFRANEAQSQRHQFDEQEAQASMFGSWSELLEALPVHEQPAFKRDFDKWVAAQTKDQNAPWPSDAEAVFTERDKGSSQDERWEATRVNWGERVSMVYRRPGKPPSSAFTPDRISEELHDLHGLFTAACRQGRDGFCWCGWNAAQWSEGGKKTRKCSPASGAHLSMMTTACARKLLPLAQQEQDTHMGFFFGNKLGLAWQHYLGSSYLWPPVGGYWTHVSTTCSTPSKPRELQHHFGHKWSQEGTRKLRPGHTHRYIMAFTARGPAVFLSGPVQLPQDLPSLVWITEPPPGTPEACCGPRYSLKGITPRNKPPDEDRGEQQWFALLRVEPLATL